MREAKNILVLIPLTADERKELEALGPQHRFTYADRKQLPQDLIDQSQVILGFVPVDRLSKAQDLEWIQLSMAGVNHYVQSPLFPASVTLTNAPGIFGSAIGEHMLAVLLMLQKNLHLYRDYQNQQRWKEEFEIAALSQSTALIIGLGDIGLSFAKHLKNFDNHIIGIRRQVTDRPANVDEVYGPDAVDQQLPRADIVAMALPETSQTRHFMTRERLWLMKPSAVLINVGRGSSLDTEALCDCLEAGHLRGAALDVTDPEPLPPQHRLWGITNAVITPHIAGGYGLPHIRAQVHRLILDNFARYVREEPLAHVVDFKRGY